MEAAVQQGLNRLLPPPLGVSPHRGMVLDGGRDGLEGRFDEDEVEHLLRKLKRVLV